MELDSLVSLDWHFIVGGLAIFLFGIEMMGNTLTNVAGPRLRGIIEKYTTNPIKGILVGVVITGLIQSSSATTLISISLVRAGLMTLNQAMNITLGANIGTTITSILIGFDIEYISYFTCFIGIFLLMISKKESLKNVGELLIAFSLLFIGLQMMGDSLSQLSNLPGFTKIVGKMSTNPWIALIIGTIFTALIQSSSAFIGIIQVLYASGTLDLSASLGLMLGSNIGTCITGVLGALGGTPSAKRTAAFHVFFNLSTAVLFLIILEPYESMVVFTSQLINARPTMVVAIGHFLYNLLGTIMFIPLIDKAAELLIKIIPGDDIVVEDEFSLHLDEQLIEEFPQSAIEQAKQAIIKESNICIEGFRASKAYMNSGDIKDLEEINRCEEIVNKIDVEVENYLMELSIKSLDQKSMMDINAYQIAQRNLERVSDYAQNLGEFYKYIFDAGENFSYDTIDDLNNYYDMVTKNIILSIKIFETGSYDLFEELKIAEEDIDVLESSLRKYHIERVIENRRNNIKKPVATTVFIDIITTLERIGDHAYNIGRSTIDPVKSHEQVAENNAVI